MFVVQWFLHWGFVAVATGKHPSERHDKLPFDAGDTRRIALANSSFSPKCVVKGAVVRLKHDLKELSTTYAFPDTSSHAAMCPCCCHTGTNFQDFENFSAMSMPFATKTDVMLSEASAACEIVSPVLDWDAFLQVRAALRSLLPIDGPRGRALIINLDHFNLRANDRLEPTPNLPDVYAIDGWDKDSYIPQSFLFWRRSCETYTRHRSPLLDPTLGITMARCNCIDFLHTFSKGIFQFFCADFFHMFFTNDVLQTGLTAWDPLVARSVQHVRAQLFQWYGAETKAGRVRTQVQQLVPGMFGNQKNTTFDLHASETNHVLPFVRTLMDTYGARIPDQNLWQRGMDSLLAMLGLYHKNGYKNFPPADVQAFCDNLMVHYRVCKRLGLRPRPKHHFGLEAARRLSITGSLAACATFPDEGLNKVVKHFGQNTHRQVWSFRVLDDFERQTGLQPRMKTYQKRQRVE